MHLDVDRGWPALGLCMANIRSISCCVVILYCLSWSLQAFAGEWSIGIYEGLSPLLLMPSAHTLNPVLSAQDVTDRDAGFVADPFLMHEDSGWYLFFEVLNKVNHQGDIGYATSDNGLDWNYQKIVLDESFHLSYPYVFKWAGNYYMVPESNEAGAIRLYRATDFPTTWEFVTTLVSGAYVDSCPFYYNGGWWMLTTPLGLDDTLRLFYADALTGPWVEHPKSPIVVGDAHIARSGGRVTQFDNRLVRFAQDDAVTYGSHVRAFEITTLTRTDYAEVEVAESPVLSATGSGWNADGMHQLDPNLLPSGIWLAAVDAFGNPQQPQGISRAQWTLLSVDSEELAGEDGAAVNAFDADPATYWHTEWLNASPSHPHRLDIDLGAEYSLSGFRYLPRQDGGVNGRVKGYAFYVSADGVNWGTALASGIFPDNAQEQQVLFATTLGRYIRFEALSEQTGGPFTSVAELNLLGVLTESFPPDSDGDGIADSADQCPNTPVGANVDINGCAASQLDADNDGVSDAQDLCPGTLAGSTVDSHGCAASQLDSDNDGVSDAQDQCPGTLAGSTVDSHGCALNQLDSDNDGVSDAQDLCPGTAAGTAVDAAGCSLDATDSNGDGISDVEATALGLSLDDPAGDSDHDGIPDIVEIGGDLSHPRDTNADGFIDALQAMVVANIPLADGSVLDMTTAPGEILSKVSAAAVTDGPSGVAFPFGAISYTTTSQNGGSVTVRLAFSVDLPKDLVLYKAGNGVYTRLPMSVWSLVDARTIDVTLTDGDPLTDLDDTANGFIEDPIAPGVAAGTATATTSGGGGGCTLAAADNPRDPMLLLTALISLIGLSKRRRCRGASSRIRCRLFNRLFYPE